MKASSWRACGAGAVALLAATAAGQTCQPGWAAGFTNVPGFDGEVRGIAYFNEGGTDVLYAAGHFANVGGQPIAGIAKWNGQAWGPVGTPGGLSPVGFNTGAYTISVLDLGSGPAVYVGGNFTSANGAPANRIARWDGQTWSAMGAGFSDTVRSITTYDDGAGLAIYASGLFLMSGETQVRGIARWTGTAWTPVGGGLVGNQHSPIGYTLKVLDMGDGPKLYVGGWFEQPTAAGVTNNIVRWDGTQWTGFGPGVYGGSANGNRFVMPIRLFDFGAGPQLTIGGCFTLVPGTPGAPRIARWTGSQWQQVGPDLGTLDEYVNSLVEHDGPQGRTLYAGGSFHTATWLNNVNYIARLGVGDWVGIQTGMDNWVRSLVVRSEPSGDRLMACGIFEQAGHERASRIAEWTGQGWRAFDQRLNGLSRLDGGGEATAGLLFDDGSGERLFVGGNFQFAGTHEVNNIATWDGAQWSDLGGGVDAAVNGLAVFDEGAGPALFAAGAFTIAGGGPSPHVARWDGTVWSSLGGNGPGGGATCLTVHTNIAGTALYVGGGFSSVAGIPVHGLACWDGTAWSDVGTGAGFGSVDIRTMASFDNGDGPMLYVGGAFGQMGQAGGLSGFAKWDGTTWSSAGLVRYQSSNGIVMSLLPTGSRLLAAGRFTTIAGVTASSVAAWDGIEWTALSPYGTPYQPIATGNGGVRTLASVGDELWVGGKFTANGPAGPGLALTQWQQTWLRLTPSTFTAEPAVVYSIVPSSDASLVYLLGQFSSVGGTPSLNIAEFRRCACQPDCNQDGSLSAADFGCFQTRFALGEAYADFNQDGVRNLADFGAFQTKFAMGCP